MYPTREKAIANVNKSNSNRDESENLGESSKKKPTEEQLGCSPARKMSKKGRPRHAREIKGKAQAEKEAEVSAEQDQVDQLLANAETFEFQEEGQVIHMEVEGGDESYAETSTASEEEADEEMVDAEISFRSRSRSRSRTVEPDTEETSSESSHPQTESEEEELERMRNETETLKQKIKEIKLIQDRQKRIKELDDEMRDKLQEIQNLMDQGELQGPAKAMAEQMLASQAALLMKPGGAKTAGMNKNINSSGYNTTKPTESQETIYKRAIPSKRGSSSSKGELQVDTDTSGELMSVEFDNLHVISPKIVGPKPRATTPCRQIPYQDAVPGPSRAPQAEAGPSRGLDRSPPQGRKMGDYVRPEQRAANFIREAEMGKIEVFPAAGKISSVLKDKCSSMQFNHTAMMDKDYITVGSHVDEATILKIKNSEYVDFGKLIPKDRVLAVDENKLELVIKGGQTFYVPVSNSTEINNFGRWEQAFRVFANIYTKFHPHRSSELIEYNHIIHTVSLSYPWDSVYLYDKDFRIHISKHPERNWSIILQQAWSLRLRDKPHQLINNNNSSFHSAGAGASSPSPGKIDEPCRRFNRGRCHFGSGCRYDHRCSYCFKMGHPVIHCRKLAADKEKDRQRGGHRREHRGHQDEFPKLDQDQLRKKHVKS